MGRILKLAVIKDRSVSPVGLHVFDVVRNPRAYNIVGNHSRALFDNVVLLKELEVRHIQGLPMVEENEIDASDVFHFLDVLLDVSPELYHLAKNPCPLKYFM